MPRSRIWWTKSSTISRSTKSRIVSRGSTSVTGTSSAEKIVAYSTPITPAPTTVSVRGRCSSSRISSLSNTRRRSNGTFAGRYGTVPTAISACSKPAWLTSPPSVVSSTSFGPTNRASAKALRTMLRMNWCCSTSTSWSRVLVSRCTEVAGRDVLLDPVAAAVEPPLAPAREVQDGLAQRLRRDRAGMHRHPAQPPAAVDHQHRLAELRRLHRRPPPRRPAADHQHVDLLHRLPPRCALPSKAAWRRPNASPARAAGAARRRCPFGRRSQGQ